MRGVAAQSSRARFLKGVEELRAAFRDVDPTAAAFVLNRLFFLQFLRHAGLLADGDCLAERAGGRSFYRETFLPLCGQHGIEPRVDGAAGLPDGFFTRWLEFLDCWDWRLAPAGDRGDGALTPAVLSEVFERSLARKAIGAYFTAPDVAGYICRSTVLPWLLHALPEGAASADEALTKNLDLLVLTLERVEALDDPATLGAFYFGRLRRLRVLDPTCGAGAFLAAARDVLLPVYAACLGRMETLCGEAGAGELRRELELAGRSGSRERFVGERILRTNLSGVDLLPEAADTCRLRLLLELIAAGGGAEGLPDLSGSIRAGDLLHREETPEHDLVVGNPPYVAYRAKSGAYRGYSTERCGNLYALVVERSLELLPEEGRLGMIVPISAVSVERYRPVAERLLRRDCWISTYSNRPAKLFEGVEQRLAIILAGPVGSRARVFASPYQHWYAEERPALFSRLTYCEASRWPRTGMPVKSGHPTAEAIFRRLLRHRGRLEDLTGAGGAAVWLHDGPTYWVRALPFPPNEGREGPRSSHYHRIPAPTPDAARGLAAVLSSTTFYFFFKMVSNCRDLGRTEWAAFPIDPLPPGSWHELVELGGRLEARLRETAAVRTRRYPSGTVEYEEYHPARAKQILDRIDRVLARHYDLTDPELDYLRDYDLRYRLSDATDH